MEELLLLLKDGKSRSLSMLAMELNKSVDEVKRDIEFLEQMNMIKRVGAASSTNEACAGCNGCGSDNAKCAGCMPNGGFQNMGVMWEVVSAK
jgi:DNA-binding Lrp family transcriptional regulator